MLKIAKDLEIPVSLVGLTTQTLFACQVANDVFAAHGFNAAITSCTDGKHKQGSKHYVGNAVDFRVRDLPIVLKSVIVTDLKESLGAQFDVIDEGTHIHIEYDPKQGPNHEA